MSAEPLTPERILDAAATLISQAGLSAFSTRKLGEVLKREAMSIYHHFPSKQHLLDGLVDRAIASVGEPPAGLPPLERVRRHMYAYRNMARCNAALFPLIALHRLNTKRGVRFIETTLGLVQAVVPDPERAARHFRTLGYYLTGAGLDETSGYALGQSAAQPVSDAYIGEHCPKLAAAAKWFKAGEWDATFRLGVDSLLAAMAADARQNAKRRR